MATMSPSGVQVVDFEAGLEALTNAHLIKEEYRTWKKNAPLLYDTLINTTLDQVSLSVEWFSDMTVNQEGQYSAQRILMGTQALADDSSNQVIISEVRLPLHAKSQSDGTNTHKLQNTGKVEVIQRIFHEGDVNRARYMPQNPNIIATKSSNKNLYIFDRTQHPSDYSKSQSGQNPDFSPQLTLVGHTQEGYGLSWNPKSLGQVVSGSADKKILMWDINANPVIANSKATESSADLSGNPATSGDVQPAISKVGIQPVLTLSAHEDTVEDVVFHPNIESMMISCGDDGLICIWDLRQPNDPIFKVTGHSEEVNAISINSFDENVFASGSSDKTVAMWDLRNLTQKLHSFEHHSDQVFAVQWSPFAPNILASSSCDRRVMIWDVEAIGEEQDSEDQEDGPPELLFMHCGHTDKVNDIAWSYNKDWLLASVSDNEVLQIWELAKAIREEEAEDAEYEDEDLE